MWGYPVLLLIWTKAVLEHKMTYKKRSQKVLVDQNLLKPKIQFSSRPRPCEPFLRLRLRSWAPCNGNLLNLECPKQDDFDEYILFDDDDGFIPF